MTSGYLHVYADDCGCDFCNGVRAERAQPAVKRIREVVAPAEKPDAFRPPGEMRAMDWRKFWEANAPKSELERALISGVEEVQRFGAMPDMAIIGGAVYRKPKMKRRP